MWWWRGGWMVVRLHVPAAGYGRCGEVESCVASSRPRVMKLLWSSRCLSLLHWMQLLSDTLMVHV